MEIETNQIKATRIAKACHEAIKIYCETCGDFSYKSWEESENWQKDSAIKGVIWKLKNPQATLEDQHEEWVKDKLVEGWRYGPTKNAVDKTHPCLIDYEKLPHEDRNKDLIFVTMVEALRHI